MNDNRASGGKLLECDIRTCPHCQAVIKLSTWKASDGNNGWCMRCNAPICGLCADKMLTEGCKPFMEQIDKLISDEYRKSQFRKLAGLEPELPVSFKR